MDQYQIIKMKVQPAKKLNNVITQPLTPYCKDFRCGTVEILPQNFSQLL